MFFWNSLADLVFIPPELLRSSTEIARNYDFGMAISMLSPKKI